MAPETAAGKQGKNNRISGWQAAPLPAKTELTLPGCPPAPSSAFVSPWGHSRADVSSNLAEDLSHTQVGCSESPGRLLFAPPPRSEPAPRGLRRGRERGRRWERSLPTGRELLGAGGVGGRSSQGHPEERRGRARPFLEASLPLLTVPLRFPLSHYPGSARKGPPRFWDGQNVTFWGPRVPQGKPSAPGDAGQGGESCLRHWRWGREGALAPGTEIDLQGAFASRLPQDTLCQEGVPQPEEP